MKKPPAGMMVALHQVDIVDVRTIPACVVVGRYDFTMHPRWKLTTRRGRFSIAFTRDDGLVAIIGCARELDGNDWLHVSMSRASSMPTYADMVDVKRDFLGDDRVAVQLFVPKSQHVNDHPYCLHLWSPLSGDLPLPDFRRGLNTI